MSRSTNSTLISSLKMVVMKVRMNRADLCSFDSVRLIALLQIALDSLALVSKQLDNSIVISFLKTKPSKSSTIIVWKKFSYICWICWKLQIFCNSQSSLLKLPIIFFWNCWIAVSYIKNKRKKGIVGKVIESPSMSIF